MMVQFLWTLLIMALVGNMIATAFSGNPSIVNYDMFVSVFGMLTLFYLIPATFKESFQGHPLLMVILDTLNAIFFFCGAVAMSAELHVHSCSNNVRRNQNRHASGCVLGILLFRLANKVFRLTR